MVIELRAQWAPRAGWTDGPLQRWSESRWQVPRGRLFEALRHGAVRVVADVPRRGPRIGLTMDLHDDVAWIKHVYVQAVWRAGGHPVLLPPGQMPTEALWRDLQGLVVTGGAVDLDPALYGQARQGRLDAIVPERSLSEMAWTAHALQSGLPLLGVCGGMQVINVVAGGTLVQDLPVWLGHEQRHDARRPGHPVRVLSPLFPWLRPVEQINSTHHQAVDRLGAGLVAAAVGPGDVLEALVMPGHPFLWGLQWHPELIGDVRPYRALLAAIRR